MRSTVARLSSFALIALAGLAAGTVVVGSFGQRTTRIYEATGGATSATVQTDGGLRWAAWTLLCGLVALGALVAWAAAPRWRPALVAVLAGAFAAPALLCGTYWLRLRDGHDVELGPVTEIGWGLRVTAVAAFAGWVVVLLLAVNGLKPAFSEAD